MGEWGDGVMAWYGCLGGCSKSMYPLVSPLLNLLTVVPISEEGRQFSASLTRDVGARPTRPIDQRNQRK
jgi:hypothetical protein